MQAACQLATVCASLYLDDVIALKGHIWTAPNNQHINVHVYLRYLPIDNGLNKVDYQKYHNKQELASGKHFLCFKKTGHEKTLEEGYPLQIHQTYL